MKRSFAIAVSLSLTLGAAVRAANPTQVQKLLNSGDCENCDLSEASLYNYVLDGVDLTGANLRAAALQGSKLNSANLSNVKGDRANLALVQLKGANLQGRKFNQSQPVWQ